MKILAWIVGVPAALFVIMLVIGSTVSDDKARVWAQQEQAEKMCANMMTDSAPGTEKRMTRAACDQAKADLEAKAKATK